MSPHSNLKAFKSHFSYFSIIELFIVLVIFAILAYLMFPALKRTTEHADTLLCKNILRQFHIADDIYAEDYNEAYVVIKSSPWGYVWFRNSDFYRLFKLNPTKCSQRA